MVITMKREKANEILANDGLSADEKLFVVFQLYKDELSIQYPQLNYALLGWKDSHIKDLWSKEVVNCLEG